MVATLDAPAGPDGNLATVLTRAQIVESIWAFNPTATTAFLDRFDDAALALYLEHLHAKLGSDNPNTPWLRPGDTPGILWHEARDTA